MIVRVTVTNQFNYCQSYDWMKFNLEWKMLELSLNPINDWIRIILNIFRENAARTNLLNSKRQMHFLSQCVHLLATGQQYRTEIYFLIGHKICKRCTITMSNFASFTEMMRALHDVVWFDFIRLSLVQFGWPKLCIVCHVSNAHHCNDAQIVVGVCILYGGFTVFARISNLLRTNCFNNIHFQFMISTTSVG